MRWDAGFRRRFTLVALTFEIARRGMMIRSQVPYTVFYCGLDVGEYVADLVVEDRLVAKRKCVDNFASEHIAQCINYLKASNLKLALLINFQKPKMEWKRIIL
jgi:GxxExxY protein